jgi:hypothetical protein
MAATEGSAQDPDRDETIAWHLFSVLHRSCP